MLCEVETESIGGLETEEDWNRHSEKQLNDLIAKGVKLTNVWKDPKLSLPLSKMFEDEEIRVSEIEGRYGKFLDSELQTSLLNIEEYLHRLRFELLGYVGEETEREKAISDLMAKIAKEIAQLRERKIDIGF